MTASDELETTLLEWAKGSYRMSLDECRVVMAELAALNHELAAERYRNVDLTHDLTMTRAHLGNAVGAIIDSGTGYCEGPHDVAAAIYRLTAERDESKADLVRVTEGRWTQIEIDACKWRGHELGLMLRSLDPAVGGAPGVSETHTDPKEAP